MDEVKALFSLFQDLFVEYTELDGFKSGSIDWEHEILCKSDISSEIKAYADTLRNKPTRWRYTYLPEKQSMNVFVSFNIVSQ